MQIPNPEEYPVLTVEEAGRILGISRGLAYQQVREGTLPSIRLGRRWLVPTAALSELLGVTPSRGLSA